MNRVVLLGTKGGPAVRANAAMPTSSLLELDGRCVVVDCGLGVTKALVTAGMDLKQLDLIFITHLHSDHILELGPLIHTAWTTGKTGAVRVYGPPGISTYWQGFMASVAYDSDIRVKDEGRVPLDQLVTVIEYDEGTILDDGIQVRALRVPHPPLADCFALRFDGSKSVTFSGDTAYFPPLAEFASGSDLLVHEALLPAGVELIISRTGLGDKLRQHLYNSHTRVEDVARIARAAGVGRLALNHLVPADDPGIDAQDWLSQIAPIWNGMAEVGTDGMEILL
ncbi:MBL fold metallo-hydrolase [Pseudorhodobacter sp.]|uniref:MBL fold metallo-hydrolase n=1 Tax=Pseudorhodobacter sp. TaxID=1934400 RepID=UPI002648EDE0|nr:MBL fold metallo-hydrolase [Pseudorhodobacter sp.]MDN5785923.1 MBL fold metallo-hydrolase [Pseudorhodobacter sp.]